MTAATAGVEPRSPRAIPVRRPSFDFSQLSRHWFGGDPFLTHLANALSLTFPEGERFFMDAVRHYEKRITSPTLRHEISRFLGQEALHARAHEAYNQWLQSQGIDAKGVADRVRDGIAEVRRRRSPRYQLAMTCALEHFTAMMAELVLEHDELRGMMEPDARRLFVWHALEETEHKAVAFDTFVASGGNYSTRVLAMFFTTIFFMATAAFYQDRLMRQDPDARGIMLRIRGLWRLWVLPGWFASLVPAYLDYYRPDFHPWDREPKGGLEPFLQDMASSVIKA